MVGLGGDELDLAESPHAELLLRGEDLLEDQRCELLVASASAFFCCGVVGRPVEGSTEITPERPGCLGPRSPLLGAVSASSDPAWFLCASCPSR